uniref:Nucleoprotein TPR n=1 Tax=Caenorhabditis japonica TaxID=281687 RepID=A0A8R1DXW4_CAEJA
MDVDAPANLAEQPVPVAEDEQTNWEIEKAELERAQFNMNREVNDLRERVEDLSRQNGQLLSELGRYGNDVKEHVNRHRELEQARNELTDKNLELETTVARLNIEKGEREAAFANATKEAQSAMVETFALKDQIRQLTNEKASLRHSVEAAQQERQSIEFERQRYSTERDLYAESKRWLMQEVTDRDNKVSSLRLELSNKDIEGANERLQYESQINFLNAQIESLNEKSELLQTNNSDLLKRIEYAELSKVTDITNLEEEIRCQQDLQRILKSSLEETKNAADHFKDQLEAQEAVLAEVRTLLQEHQEEMDQERTKHAKSLSQLEEELARTRSELDQVNVMMKSMSEVKLNVSEEELSGLAPAAAETVKFLKGGQSLSSLVLEHARVCGKLAETEEENGSLRSTLEELLEAIQQNKPHILSQRMVADELYDKSSKFEKQLDEAEVERKELATQRDTAQRDLAYVRAELEKYQRDYEFVTQRNVQLMYAIEQQKERIRDPTYSDEPNEQLFLTCAQLQRRNVELESDIENAKNTAAQAAMNAQSAEMAQLRADLAVTKKSEAELKTKVDQTKAAFDSLKERTEHFKELVRDSVTASEARAARLKAEEAVAAKVVADATIERLTTQASEYKADYQRRSRELEQRIQSTEVNINSVTETNIKLNAMLEAQKANTAAMEQEYKAAIKDKETAMEELRKVVSADAEKERKLVNLGRQALEATDQAGTLRVRVRALEDELQSAKSEVTSLRMANDGQRAVLEKEEQVRMSVVEMANFLSRVETEKLNHSNTQLDTIKHERDSLKASTTRLSDQLTHAKNDAKLIQHRLEKELEIVRNRLKDKEEQLSREEMELVDLRSKLASVQGQFTGSDASGMTPDRLKREYLQLKNRTQFIENELDEAKRKLMEAEAAQKRMDAEHAISATHNNVLEENLKQSEQMGAMERDRLLASVKCFEERAQQLTDRLAENQVELDGLRTRYDELVFKSEQETAELQRQIQVSSLNLEGVKRELGVANSNLLNVQNENTRNATALEQHNSVVHQFEQQISEIENARLRLQAELNNKALALVAETTAKNEADQLREHTERLLKQKTEERDRLELELQQKQTEYEEKLIHLSNQYESLSSNITSARDTSMEMDQSTIGEPSQSGMIENLQSLLQFVRQSKDEATHRAMNAEIEMRRLRAETAEFERGKNELLQKIRDLETEKIATAASLIDRARLIEKVESLTNVHNLNAQLNEEKTQLQALVAQFQKEKTELEKQNSILSEKNNEQNLRIAASNQETLQRRKEIELLKQKAESGTKGGPASALQTQLDQLKTQLQAARQEASTASAHATLAERAKLKAEENAKSVSTKLTQTRQLAIKYRDETKISILNIFKKCDFSK